MRKRRHLVAILIVGALAVAAFGIVPVLRRSAPGRIIRWCLGEPLATQQVNDAADRLISSGWDQELIDLSDQLMDEYASTASTLPKGADRRSLPLDRLPRKLRELGGMYGEPELIVRLDDASTPTEIMISWGNMRHVIIVYAEPPAVPPSGFFVRQVNDRIYVVANES